MSELGQIDHNTSKPINVQVSDAIRMKILSREWSTDYQLPSEPELAQMFGVSRGTLRRALGRIIREGLLVQIHGRGTFVTATALEPSIAQKLSTLTEDLAHRGREVRTHVISARVVSSTSGVASLLDVATGQRVLELERVRSVEEGPFAVLKNFVRLDVAPGLEEADFSTASLFGELEATHMLKIATGRRTFKAVVADAELAHHLKVQRGFPLLHLEQLTYLADGRPIEYSDVWLNTERMQVSSLLTR